MPGSGCIEQLFVLGTFTPHVTADVDRFDVINTITNVWNWINDLIEHKYP
jgi:hypothetical protein